MKTTLYTIIVILFTQYAFAQKEPLSYEWFEEQSKIISDLQVKAGSAKSKYYGNEEITFGTENFSITYSDSLASLYVTKKNETDIDGFLVEDIDFTKAIGITKEDNVVYVHFPMNSLTLQKYSKDNSVEKCSIIDFYSKTDEDAEIMFHTLYYLIAELNLNKNPYRNDRKYEEVYQQYKKLGPYEFYLQHKFKYSHSILLYEGMKIEENIALDKINRSKQFVLDLAKKYGGYEQNMNLEEFAAISESHKNVLESNHERRKKGYHSGKNKRGVHGIYELEIDSNKIEEYTYVINLGSKNANRKFRDELQDLILENVDSKYIYIGDYDMDERTSELDTSIRVEKSIFERVLIWIPFPTNKYYIEITFTLRK